MEKIDASSGNFKQFLRDAVGKVQVCVAVMTKSISAVGNEQSSDNRFCSKDSEYVNSGKDI